MKYIRIGLVIVMIMILVGVSQIVSAADTGFCVCGGEDTSAFRGPVSKALCEEYCGDKGVKSWDGDSSDSIHPSQCSNGQKDPGETGVDCGGTKCPACPTTPPPPAAQCNNKVKDPGETGVDCGGPCPACPPAAPATCVDMIKNQGELGVDCGGPCSTDCTINNQDSFYNPDTYQGLTLFNVEGDPDNVYGSDGRAYKPYTPEEGKPTPDNVVTLNGKQYLENGRVPNEIMDQYRDNYAAARDSSEMDIRMFSRDDFGLPKDESLLGGLINNVPGVEVNIGDNPYVIIEGNYYNPDGTPVSADDKAKIDKALADDPSLAAVVNTGDSYTKFLHDTRFSMAQSMALGSSVWQLLTSEEGGFGWTDLNNLFDWMKPFNEFFQTRAGMAISGNWEASICAITTDYDALNENGVLMPPGATSPAAWVAAEKQLLIYPNATDPTIMEHDYFYKISLMVSPTGLTIGSGEDDCDNHVKFKIEASPGSKELDIDGDGVADQIFIGCDKSSYTLSGAGALVFRSKAEFSKICIKFVGTNLKPSIKELLDGGDKLCNDIVPTGSDPELGDCPYCDFSGSGGSFGGMVLPGMDMCEQWNMFCGNDDDDDDDLVDEERPVPGSVEGGTPGFV
ncbi:MAG: hypothetical protein KKE20_06075 [Nanoarchaeota archaeon]|nr:hypothetical protein [Nanoarchaeota archaeon]